MKKVYDAETLKRLKKAELNILKDFDNICKKYEIHYFLVGGSLLGAIRHGGFIPWDDDIDVGMTREEYNKFFKVMPKELGKDYILATPTNYSGYCGAIIKLMRKNTKFIPEFCTEMKCDLGIHIDIFVWDNLCDKRAGAWFQIKAARILSQLIFLCGSSKPEIPGKGIQKFILQNICRMMHFVLNRIPDSEKKLYRCFEKVSKKENNKTTKYITSFQTHDPYKHTYHKQDLIPYTQKNFEGFNASVQNNYKENLYRCFGSNYMSLPPKELRVNHCAEVIDFGDIY